MTDARKIGCNHFDERQFVCVRFVANWDQKNGSCFGWVCMLQEVLETHHKDVGLHPSCLVRYSD